MATPTTRIVPVAIELKPLSPVRYMPAIAAMTVKPEIEDGAARRGGGGLERGLGVAPRLALLALAADVEQRVVDADGEADEQDDRHQVVGGRRELADAGDDAHRAEDGGEAEQQRQAGGDERAEGEQQDDAA